MILRKYQHSPEKGFTLIEMMIVMLIMAIMLSISLPAFRSIGRGSALRNAVSSVYNTLSMARQWAITHKENVTFKWNNPLDTNSCFYVFNDEANLSPTNELPLEIKFDSSCDNNITFKPDGGLPNCIQKTITLQDRKKVPVVEKKITINGLTGGIHVE